MNNTARFTTITVKHLLIWGDVGLV